LAARDEHLQSRQAVAQAAITVYQALGGGW
jgi:outer membrane protein TolC